MGRPDHRLDVLSVPARFYFCGFCVHGRHRCLGTFRSRSVIRISFWILTRSLRAPGHRFRLDAQFFSAVTATVCCLSLVSGYAIPFRMERCRVALFLTNLYKLLLCATHLPFFTAAGFLSAF